MSYYESTIGEIRAAIKLFPMQEGKQYIVDHVNWMLQEIEQYDEFSLDDALKAGRWIGWILAHVETIFSINNLTSRAWVAIDVAKKYDRPINLRDQ